MATYTKQMNQTLLAVFAVMIIVFAAVYYMYMQSPALTTTTVVPQTTGETIKSDKTLQKTLSELDNTSTASIDTELGKFNTDASSF